MLGVLVMKNGIKFTVLVLLAVCLALSQLSACASVNPSAPTPTTYWNEDSSGSIQTNDITKLQKEAPFIFVLPEYLPDGLKSYQFDMNMYKIDQVVNLQIYYYYLKGAKEIQIHESPPPDLYPQPLPTGFLAKMRPDYNSLELGGTEVLEKNSFDTIIRSGQKTEVSSFNYVWERNNIHFMVSILGYDQAESRKITESMVK